MKGRMRSLESYFTPKLKQLSYHFSSTECSTESKHLNENFLIILYKKMKVYARE